jgi:excisionase family DNA binding protein
MTDATKLNNTEAAQYLGVAPATLVTWRCTQRYSIPYIRVGKKILYDLDDLRAWLASRKVHTPAQGRELSCR